MKHFTSALLAASSALAITGATWSTTVYAATTPSTKLPQGQVRAEVNGKSIEAIAVGNETYVNWAALNAFHTPHKYMGNGTFAVSWGTIYGVVYHGATYIPWTQAAPKVKSAKLPGGGFNFTSVAVKHHYHLDLLTQDAITGMPAPIEVMTSDGNNPVPGQKITVETSGNSVLENTSGVQTVNDTVDSTGTWLGGIYDMTPQTVTLTVKWTDPSGQTHVKAEQVSFINGNVGASNSNGSSSNGSGSTTTSSGGTSNTSSTSNVTSNSSSATSNSSSNSSTSASSVGTSSSNSAIANSSTSNASSNTATNTTSSTTGTTSGSSQTAAPGTTVVTTVPMQTFQNEALFAAKVSGDPILFQLDTGAFEPLINKRTAALLNLPHLSNVQVAGIGGNDNAYMSRITLSIGGVVFQDVPCVVDTSYSGNNLFGYGFFSDNQYNLYASQTSDTLTILE